MRRTDWIALFVILSMPVFANGAEPVPVQNERSVREECSYAKSGIRGCLEEKAKASETALRQEEDNVRTSLAKWDEDAKYINLAKTRFDASSKEFAKYRKAQCEFAGSLGGGAIGNALETMRLACVFELNAARTEQLKRAVSELPVK